MIRVFPRRTKWTPADELAFVGDPPLAQFRPEDRDMPVFISVAFTWDLKEAKRLQGSWGRFYRDVRIGGPATGDHGGKFVAGRFLKPGVTITSRGCVWNCPWCLVPRREGVVRELPVVPGYIVQDNNLLACSNRHLDAVFTMLAEQKRGIVFSGGLDARLFSLDTLRRLKGISVSELWFAADSAGAMEHLSFVGDICRGAEIPQEKLRCYTMIGFRGESLDAARSRLERVYAMGFLPFAQLYRGEKTATYSPEWRALARKWSRPAAYRIARKQ